MATLVPLRAVVHRPGGCDVEIDTQAPGGQWLTARQLLERLARDRVEQAHLTGPDASILPPAVYGALRGTGITWTVHTYGNRFRADFFAFAAQVTVHPPRPGQRRSSRWLSAIADGRPVARTAVPLI